MRHQKTAQIELRFHRATPPPHTHTHRVPQLWRSPLPSRPVPAPRLLRRNVADVATDPRNASRFFVVDGDGGPNNRLLALDWASGRVLWSRGGAPTAKPGGFDVPHSVAWDAGRQAVWVADRSNNRTQVLSARDGSFLFEWSCFLPGSQPWSVRIDSVRGTVLVADGTAGYLYVMPLPSADDPNPACRVSQALPLPPAAAKLHEMAVDETTGAIYIAQVGDPTALLKLRVMPTGRD